MANLGDERQKAWLDGVFRRGELGSFLLTERGAGVLSGLIVETEARFVAETGTFDLHSPAPVRDSAKYWISQGFTAKWGVVIARLLMPGGRDLGPHAFVVDLESAGVHKKDMERKTVFNSLDNCEIWFDHVTLQRTDLLSGISFVDAQGAYRLVDESTPFSFYRVAQRLLSGRICLSLASLERVRTIVKRVSRYAEQRMMPVMGSRGVTTPLFELRSLREAFASFSSQATVYQRYLEHLCAQFADESVPISPRLVDEIACAKIMVVDFALQSLANLKARVGAYSLMKEGAFDFRHCEIFYLIRFAEGDSGILAQKMAKDALRVVSTPQGILSSLLRLPSLALRSFLASTNSPARARCLQLRDMISLAFSLFGLRGSAQMHAWLNNHALVEKIARRAAFLTIHDVVSRNASADPAFRVNLSHFSQLINAEN